MSWTWRKHVDVLPVRLQLTNLSYVLLKVIFLFCTSSTMYHASQIKLILSWQRQTSIMRRFRHSLADLLDNIIPASSCLEFCFPRRCTRSSLNIRIRRQTPKLSSSCWFKGTVVAYFIVLVLFLSYGFNVFFVSST